MSTDVPAGKNTYIVQFIFLLYNINMLDTTSPSMPIQSSRLLSLDVFRGITIVLMILVNSPGNQATYSFLEHSTWNGCTLADVVFPFFIFIVGVSSVFSLSKARELGITSGKILSKIIKRSCLIFALGLLLNAFPHHFDWTTLRFFGVLQRIAVCYLFAALCFLTTRLPTQIACTMILLLGYGLLMTCFPLIDANNNLAAMIDRRLFSSSHLYGKTFDPEGVLSTIPAFASVLLGMITGEWLRSKKTPTLKFIGMMVAGLVALSFGYFWGHWFPINKTLWTSTYVLWTTGIAWLVFAGCFGAIEIKNYRRWTLVFKIFGVNALAAYVLSIFFLKIQALVILPLSNGTPVHLRLFITDTLFSWASLPNASLFYAISYTLFWFIIMAMLYHKKIIIKL
jgi:predicted acyltransferase